MNEWIKPCENHLHWSATSTFSGNGLVIWAKFKSFLRHIVNQHSNHSDPLFNKYAHGSDIPARKWLTIGMCVYIHVHLLYLIYMYIYQQKADGRNQESFSISTNQLFGRLSQCPKSLFSKDDCI